MKNRYQVSDEFKEECKSNFARNRQGKIHVIEDNIDIEGENYEGQLVDFTIEDNCYVSDTFVGTTVAKKITVNILNPDNSINLENKEIEAYAGINNEWIPFGNFIIEKPNNEEAKQKTSFTGYDYMIKFNVPYKDRVKYPIKASELFQDVCNQVGLEAGNTDFINANYMILGNPFTNGEDCRTVLSNIAQLAGTFAKIGRDNKVYIVSLKNLENILIVKYVDATTVKELNLTMVKVLSGEADNAEEKIDGNNYFEDFSKNEQWGGLNSLVLAISDIEGENTALDDKADIEKNGLTEITIQDNYFLTDQAEREKVIVPLWNSLKGLKYLPFKTEYYGYPYLDVGDMIYIQDTKDNGYISYVFNHKFTYNGSFKGSLETQAMTKTQTAYKNTFDLKTKFKQVERKIDKINGVIEDVVEEQTETSEKLTQHEQTINGMKDTVSSVEEKVETVEQKADGAQKTADGINKNLTENYYTKTEANSQMTQEANRVKTEVNETISTAKQDAIDSANANTDTKLEKYTTTVQSLIDQKGDNILASVKGDYATKTELGETKTSLQASIELKLNKKDLVSEINASADMIRMRAGKFIFTGDNFSLDEYGNITATGGTIGGFALGATEFTGNLDGIYNYNEYDIDIAANFFFGNFSDLDLGILKEILDVTGNGSINAADTLAMMRIIYGLTENTKRVLGNIKINSKDPKNALCITKDGELCVSLGVGGVNTNSLSTRTITCGTIDTTGDSLNFNGISLSSSTLVLNYGLNGTTRQCVTLNKDKFRMEDYDGSGNWIEISPLKGISKQFENARLLSVLWQETLYENASGTNGTVTLSGSASNYDYIEIFYKDNNDSEHKSVKVQNPNGKKVDMTCIEASSDGRVMIRTNIVTISEAQITRNLSSYLNIEDKAIKQQLTNNYTYITKVVGYK